MAEDQTQTGTEKGAAEDAEAGAAAEEKRSSIGETARTLVQTLWFPAFFFVGFLVCYLLPFHNPVPHHVEVAVPGHSAVQLQHALDQKSPGAFDIKQVADPAAAQSAVTDRDAVAGFVPGADGSHLYTAKADGYSLESVLQKTFTSVSQQSGSPLHLHEVAPTAAGDGMGTGLFYLVLACTIPSYVMVMMLLRATNFSRRKKIVTLMAASAVMSVVAYFVALGMDVIPSKPLAILFLFLMSQAVAQTSLALVPFTKQFFPGVAMGLFVLLSMPSSGGAIPVQMVPGFFRALHPIMPMGNLIEALRGHFYFGNIEVWRHIAVIGGWIVLAVVLHGLGVWKDRRALARQGADEEEVPEPPVEDPAIEMPGPSAIAPHTHKFGQSEPMLTGRVTDQHGSALSGVAITVTGTHGRELVRAMSDQNGEYAATGLPDTSVVNVIASSPDRLASVARVVVREGHPVRQDFRLQSRNRQMAGVNR